MNQSNKFIQVKNHFESFGYRIVDFDFKRPWGGFLVIDEKQAKKFAVIEARAIDVIAFNEKCRNTVSWANIIPAKGAPKPAEMAAATPLPIIISCWILGINCNLLRKEDIVAPKWTKGP